MKPVPAAQGEDLSRWLASTPLLDLGEAKISLRARALTQLLRSEREKAVALFLFAKALPYARPVKLRVRMPREVLHAGRGDALDKLGVLLALLRVAGIPARIRVMPMDLEWFRGLTFSSRTGRTVRAVLEAWVDGRWLLTDTYVYDQPYIAAARQRMNELRWDRGLGMSLEGDASWDGTRDSFLVGEAYAREQLVPAEEAVYSDPAEFVQSPFVREIFPPLSHAVLWNAWGARNEKVIREMREEDDPSPEGGHGQGAF